MVTVTTQAAEMFRKELQAATTNPEAGIRLILSSPDQIRMSLDTEKEGDQVVESEGVKILLLDPEVARILEGRVIDYKETSQGGSFTISKLAPDT